MHVFDFGHTPAVRQGERTFRHAGRFQSPHGFARGNRHRKGAQQMDNYQRHRLFYHRPHAYSSWRKIDEGNKIERPVEIDRRTGFGACDTRADRPNQTDCTHRGKTADGKDIRSNGTNEQCLSTRRSIRGKIVDHIRFSSCEIMPCKNSFSLDISRSISLKVKCVLTQS